jgi:exopolyphosphatase/guanosine-5'-triphosphate,3'-diphosphate pyrophosphatase
MSKRLAVMDLGTNTFHLLVAEAGNNGFVQVDKDYEPVKLGEGGINQGTIKPDAYQRGISAMQRFANKIINNGVDNARVKALATSALRSASNGQQFVDEVKNQTGISIEIINGDKEAEYIYYGVKASGALTDDTSLVLDIGGGSVEFIICNQHQIFWKQSFEIGAVRLKDKYCTEDPISPSSVAELHAYLQVKLEPLFTAARQYPVKRLIGSAGSFETFAAIIERINQTGIDLETIKCYDFNLDEFTIMTDRLIASTQEERLAMKSIIPLRINTIVVASLITRFVLAKAQINEVAMCAYSLKEGVMAVMMD